MPSGEKSTAVTGSLCAGIVLRQLPVAMSHNLMLSSKDPEARMFPEGWNARQKT